MIKFFVQIFDAYDCELDFMGPYNTENDAHEAAWSKWDGDDNVFGSRIVKRLPAFIH